MLPEDFDSLRFNTPIHSKIDGAIWLYDCNTGQGTIKIFKKLVEDSTYEGRYHGRSYIRNYGEPWRREGGLTIPMSMFMEDFELVYKVMKKDLILVQKQHHLTEPYSIVNPNFHMLF